MKRKMISKLITAVMAATFIINGLTITKVDATSNEISKKDMVVSRLNPVPQEIEVSDGTVTLTSSVNIKGSDVADKDALRILTEFLTENNITINENYNEESTTLIIGEVDDNIAEMDAEKEKLGLNNISDLKDEGYVLAVDGSKEGGTILIEGKDGDGTFYGVKTLEQLIENKENTITAEEVIIKDEPSMRTRGIVEGFYGNPWSQQDRLNQIKFYGDQKMNTYIYAPKDDPYHRTQWRQPYPESQMARMKELIDTSKENKVDFVFALSPGIDIRFDGAAGESDFQALINKCESLYQMGVRSFAIFYDDINNRDGVKQASLLNRFNDEFIKAKGDVKPLITVPTEYDTQSMGPIDNLNQYTRNFSKTLSSDIEVMWTGSLVVPEGIDLENVNFVNSIYGKRMGIWWNYPVTDYMKSKLALGPVYGLDKALEGEVNFFTMNPMEHADLSKITLSTGADYSWNTSEYDYDKAWNKAIELQFGDLAPWMKIFANHSTRMDAAWGTGREDAPEVRETMDLLWTKLAKNGDVTKEMEALYSEFNNMVVAADTLKGNLPSNVLQECNSNLSKLKLLGENGKVALDYINAKVDNNNDEANRLKGILEGNIYNLSNGSRVSEKTALAFIKESMSYDPYPQAEFKVSSTLVSPGEEVKFTNLSSIVTSDVEWIFEGANIDHSTETNPTVTYEREGVYSVTLKGKNNLGEDVEVKQGLVTVIDSATENKKNLSIGKTATASSYVVSSEAPKYAIDNNGRTKWCAVGYGPHTLTVDLGSINTISEIGIKHAESGGEAAGSNTHSYTVEVSTDGVNYTEFIKVVGNKEKQTMDNAKVTKARYVRLRVDKATQGDDLAARIYEFQIMGLEGDVELPPAYEKPEDIVVSKPSNLKTVEVTSNSVSLNWDEPENKTGLIGYEIYKGGKLLKEVDTNSYNVEGLKANSIYGFKVVSKYKNGERSNPISINVRTIK